MADQTPSLRAFAGWPVAHSRSPVIHNHWLAHYGIPGRYVLFPVPPEARSGGTRALRRSACTAATSPTAQAGDLPLLDCVDDLARKIGAVNTVVVEKDGTLTGFNNDGNGFIQSLRDANLQWRPDSGPIVVLGAGGAARAVVASLAAQGAKEIRLANRTLDKAQEIADAVGPVVRVLPWDQRADALDGAALLANATSLGMAGQPPLEISLDRLPKGALVRDLITSRPRRRCSRRHARKHHRQRPRVAAQPGTAGVQRVVRRHGDHAGAAQAIAATF
jgi:shikimate dehydrogenase